jgi:hypothetical protein
MINKILSKFTIFTILALLALNSCANRGDARKTSPDPTERVKDNIEQGKGISLKETFNLGKKTNFEFASSNELWRASLDTIDFMPLTSANYSGGIIITDWYSENENTSESIKLVIRFLTNEIRSDAIDLKIFYKNCRSINNCKVSEKVNELNTEITKEILKRATRYKEEAKDKKK